MYLIFDTETTGLPKSWNAPITDTNNWPRCVQIAWQLHDEFGKLLEHDDFLIIPEDYNIPYDAERIHGISTELAMEQGINLNDGLNRFNEALEKTTFVVGQNVTFDLNIMGCEFHRAGMESPLNKLPILDTCTERTASLCQIPGGRGGKFKLPTLTELHQFLFQVPFSEAHNATADVEATTRCFLELIRTNNFTEEELLVNDGFLDAYKTQNPALIQGIGLKHVNLKKQSEKIAKKIQKSEIATEDINLSDNIALMEDATFAHLHNHTQFTILQSTMQIKNMVNAAVKNNHSAVALTDSGNMMAAFHFVTAVLNHNKTVEAANAELVAAGKEPSKKILKPIVGCEFNICDDHLNKKVKDNGYAVVLLAKNKNGYHNIAKMSSIAFVDGFYYIPRIDRKIVEKYKEDVIVLTGNMNGEVPNKILNLGERQAEEALLWWKEQFGEDLYIEIMRHGQEDEDRVNKTLISFSKKHAVKLIATNNTFYLERKDSIPHDILLCVKDGEKQATPKGRGRGYRYGLPNDEYYFKSSSEMKALFKDLPQSITNIQHIVDKIEVYTLARSVLLPAFDIGEEFEHAEDLVDGGKRGENAYLRHITYKGAKIRYGEELSDEVTERLDFELDVIRNTGYPGYFLIVEDFIRAARKMDVSVGPGRGSAAGSVVAYCLWITNIDPLKYKLLFERFLNPERVSMPDIDIDFDDEGRGRVMDYVIEKYGANQVAQIITYGTMAAKSSIRDTARVLDLPLFEADRIAKLIPEMTKLNKIFSLDDKGLREKFRSEEIELIEELKRVSQGNGLDAEVINKALVLEGSVRNTGIHACGVIITPDDITKYVPVALAKDSDMYVTQFDNSVVEDAGLLKMDFLGLKTLTLIKDACALVKEKHGVDLDPEEFDLEDVKTYELFQRGETVGIFQYESAGMQKYMRELKPTVFDDLIAMNALYRPGPIEYIPSFINRKHGIEDIEYDLADMEEYLKETYGITVYQEQVMLLSQKLADFTKGEADVLRKAMGKKQISVLAKMKPKFIENAKAKGHNEEKLEKIWTDWEAFASYAFNKSHSTCYAWIAYQTAFLKAHYPAEYMAAVLSNNMNDIKKVSFFMEECKRMGLEVLGPDINESSLKFTVNDNGAVRFGMGAIKGVGNGAIMTIINNRKEDGKYKSVFDLAKRIDLRAANKRAFEGLLLAGGFDSFSETHRAQYMAVDGNTTFLEKAMRFGNKFQESKNSAQISMFGEHSEVQIPEPIIPDCEPWGVMETLSKEKEVVGIYISGHPLDDFKTEIKYFCPSKLSSLANPAALVNQELSLGGIVTEVQHRVSKNGKGWGAFFIEDYSGSHEFRIFGEEYLRHKHFLIPNAFLYLKVFVKPGWNNGDVRFMFTNVLLLQDILGEFAKKITISFNLKQINKEMIAKLNAIISAFQGQKNLHIVINHPEEKISLEMPSRTRKIDITDEFIGALKKGGYQFKLNS